MGILIQVPSILISISPTKIKSYLSTVDLSFLTNPQVLILMAEMVYINILNENFDSSSLYF